MKISERIAKLIDVKSIVTIVLTVIFGVLSLRNVISGEQFLTIFTVIISFYFGSQSVKNQSNSSYESLTSNTIHQNNNLPSNKSNVGDNNV